jgi:hypothetical protein
MRRLVLGADDGEGGQNTVGAIEERGRLPPFTRFALGLP